MSGSEGFPAQNEAQKEEQEFNAQAFLEQHGIESLGDRMVADHEGNPMPLAQALAQCEPARQSIQAAVEMVHDMGGKDADILTPMTSYLDKLSAQASSPDAKKKEI